MCPYWQRGHISHVCWSQQGKIWGWGGCAPSLGGLLGGGGEFAWAGLVTAVARVDLVWGLGVEDIARFTEAEGDLEEVTGEGRELVTAVDEDVDITRLDTAIDVVVLVVVGVDEVALELVEEELASALLRA